MLKTVAWIVDFIQNNMKIINNKEEFEKFVGHSFWDMFTYDVEVDWALCEMDYQYPILVEFAGFTSKGKAYKIYTKDDASELRKFLEI